MSKGSISFLVRLPMIRMNFDVRRNMSSKFPRNKNCISFQRLNDFMFFCAIENGFTSGLKNCLFYLITMHSFGIV